MTNEEYKQLIIKILENNASIKEIQDALNDFERYERIKEELSYIKQAMRDIKHTGKYQREEEKIKTLCKYILNFLNNMEVPKKNEEKHRNLVKEFEEAVMNFTETPKEISKNFIVKLEEQKQLYKKNFSKIYDKAVQCVKCLFVEFDYFEILKIFYEILENKVKTEGRSIDQMLKEEGARIFSQVKSPKTNDTALHITAQQLIYVGIYIDISYMIDINMGVDMVVERVFYNEEDLNKITMLLLKNAADINAKANATKDRYSRDDRTPILDLMLDSLYYGCYTKYLMLDTLLKDKNLDISYIYKGYLIMKPNEEHSVSNDTLLGIAKSIFFTRDDNFAKSPRTEIFRRTLVSIRDRGIDFRDIKNAKGTTNEYNDTLRDINKNIEEYEKITHPEHKYDSVTQSESEEYNKKLFEKDALEELKGKVDELLGRLRQSPDTNVSDQQITNANTNTRDQDRS